MSYIQQISPIDIHWSQSFPLLVTPRKDEWLAGLLLRCDEVNCWESGGTLTSIFQLGKRINRKKDANLVIPTLRMLDQFAECLALPMEYLLTTTFYTEISRCYGTFYPHVSQLNRSLSFQVCPGCVASSRLLTRSLVLPYLHFCPYHHIALVNCCQCGSRLRLFSAYSSPFLCSVCNADWAALPSLVAHP